MTGYLAEPTAGLCTLCPDPEKARVPHRGPVCNACRSWLAGLIADLRILHEQLTRPESPVRDVRVGTFHTRVWVDRHGWVTLTRDGWRDPVANAYPAGPVPGQSTGPRVSGTHGAPVPADLSRVDLTLPAWPGSLRPYLRGLLGEDDEQVGDLPPATVLGVWVQDWRAARDKGEGQPTLTVDAMCRWLGDRVEWACDSYSELPAMAAQLRTYRSILRRVLGLSERPDYKFGVPCPKCHQRNLLQRVGSDWVECGSCPTLLSPAEYRALVGDQTSVSNPA